MAQIVNTLLSTVIDDSRDKPNSDGDGRVERTREVLSAFLGRRADMDEVRAMLRAWIDGVRGQNLPPEQALKEFKTMLPMGGAYSQRQVPELGARSAAQLISIFIEEYYRGQCDADEPLEES